VKKTAILSVLVFGLTGALAAIPAFASSTLYTTLGPGGSYNASGYFGVGGNYLTVADPFSLGAAATVSDAVLALGNVTNSYYVNDDPVSVFIESDSGGSPGSVLASLTQVGTIPSIGNGFDGGLVTFTCSGSACNLGAGSYWLVALESDSHTFQAWDYTYNSATSTIEASGIASATGPWSSAPNNEEAFEIDGAGAPPVPEPSSFLLLASGLAGLAGMVKRKLRG